VEAGSGGDHSSEEVGSANQRRRLRAATRSNLLIVIVVVGAVAAPIFLSYAGFDPAPKRAAARYPKLQIYLGVRTPGQGLDHGLDFSQI
jgi:hypothetical protein